MNMKVVVIDDEVNIRDTVSEMLEATGYTVFAAADGEAGLALMRLHQPDIMVCDIMMPGMDGFEVLYRVRNDAQQSDIPFLFLSAKSDTAIVRKAMNLGSDDFVPKPFKAKELLHAIETKVHRFKVFKQRLNEKIDHLASHFRRHGFHELNTPINGILGAVDFMIEYDHMLQAKERVDLLNGIKVSAMRMRRTYTNFMLYFKISEGEDVYSTRWTSNMFAAADVVHERLTHFYDTLRLPIFDFEDARLPMHGQAVELLLFELADNAIKFGDMEQRGQLTGKISPDGKMYVVEVRDHGRGMTQQQIENLGPMTQFNRKQHEQQGLGLGLYLTKYIVERAKGSLVFEIGSCSGTMVRVSIPLSEGAAADKYAASDVNGLAE